MTQLRCGRSGVERLSLRVVGAAGAGALEPAILIDLFSSARCGARPSVSVMEHVALLEALRAEAIGLLAVESYSLSHAVPRSDRAPDLRVTLRATVAVAHIDMHSRRGGRA